MLLTTIISKIQESCNHLFLINLFVISPIEFIFSKTFDSQFSYTEVWLAVQNSKPLKIEYKINFALVIIKV